MARAESGRLPELSVTNSADCAIPTNPAVQVNVTGRERGILEEQAVCNRGFQRPAVGPRPSPILAFPLFATHATEAPKESRAPPKSQREGQGKGAVAGGARQRDSARDYFPISFRMPMLVTGK